MRRRLLLPGLVTNQKPTERGVITPLQVLLWGDYVIISTTELLSMPEFAGKNEVTLARKLRAIETAIRSYTNNNFQNRPARIEAASSETELLGYSPYIAVGDTVQISESINNGLYVVTAVDAEAETTTLDTGLFEAETNTVTKIVYPDDVIEGVINIMLWEITNRAKVGIKSETLSRHSVTYFDQDAGNQSLGYPASLMGFLKPYMKARF